MKPAQSHSGILVGRGDIFASREKEKEPYTKVAQGMEKSLRKSIHFYLKTELFPPFYPHRRFFV